MMKRTNCAWRYWTTRPDPKFALICSSRFNPPHPTIPFNQFFIIFLPAFAWSWERRGRGNQTLEIIFFNLKTTILDNACVEHNVKLDLLAPILILSIQSGRGFHIKNILYPYVHSFFSSFQKENPSNATSQTKEDRQAGSSLLYIGSPHYRAKWISFFFPRPNV